MTQSEKYVNDRIKTHKRDCESKFVRWQWVAVLAVTTIGAAFATALKTGQWSSKIESRIEKIELKQVDIDNILDVTAKNQRLLLVVLERLDDDAKRDPGKKDQ